MNTEANSLCAWRLAPMRDFLLDHTLTQKDPAGRLAEVVSRWVQFVGSLWSWRHQATFALRFLSDGKEIDAWILAAPHAEPERGPLQHDITVLLRAHGFIIDPSSQLASTAAWSLAARADRRSVIAEVRQLETTQLWQLPKRVAMHKPTRDQFAWVSDSDWKAVRVLYPWWAPGGPFLLPMEQLLSQPVPCSITTYLEPTELTKREFAWLGLMAREAQSYGDQSEQSVDQAAATRRVDPTASLAGRLFMANLRRLSDKPFLAAVHCEASDGRADVARSLAASIESIIYEQPSDRPQQDDERLPSAAEVRITQPDDSLATQLREQNATLRFPECNDATPLSRLPYLVDARGAATAFRLPVSVRGGVPGIAVKQRPPDFHPGPRDDVVHSNEIVLGHLHQGGAAKTKRNELTKHTLITGFTGSGKTVTVLNLIHQIHSAKVPFLAIESAKQEYRGLLAVPAFVTGAQRLRVYTVGNETCAPLRLNPFELLTGVRVESHISRLQVCFEAALPPIGPLSSMIGEALVGVYERLGWRLTDVAPTVGDRMFFAFPTMKDFFDRMDRLVDERGYEGDVRSNVRAAVLGRIKPLTIGSKGMIFRDVQEHVPGAPRGASIIEDLLSGPVVLELNDLNVEDKALVVMFVLTFLREYREQRPAPSGELAHVTVVEEAHNVLENVQSSGNVEGGGSDTRFKAVQAFSNLLSEVRALGEGLIIADQSPEKLAPDAMRNTNLQIAHQLRDAKDRDAVARAMIMDDEQRDFLGKLEPGQAALFMTGLQKATFIQVPRYYPSSEDMAERPEEQPAERVARLAAFPGNGYRPVEESELRAHMAHLVAAYRTGPFDIACRWCPVRTTCDYRPRVLAALAAADFQAQFAVPLDQYRTGESNDRLATIEGLLSVSLRAAALADGDHDLGVAWCAFIHLWHRDVRNLAASFPVESRQQYCAAFTANVGRGV